MGSEMKSLLIGMALASMASVAIADDCVDLVHKRTMVPLSELSTSGNNHVTRNKTTTHSVFGGPVYTEFQCDGKGLYRQLLPIGWSVWRTGNEWNAVHWITF